MEYLDWLETTARLCHLAVNVRGGAMCRKKDGRVGYCDFESCPRRKDNGI